MSLLDSALEVYEKSDQIDPKTLHHIVLDYLVNGCYSETTQAFMTDISPGVQSEMSDNIQLVSPKPIELSQNLVKSINIVEYRKAIRALVMAGKMEETFSFCQRTFPDALTGEYDACKEIVFELQCQHFIELVKSATAIDALNYVQQVLEKIDSLESSYLIRLQDLISLIAYPNPYLSPQAHYLNDSRKELVAEKLNKHILEFLNLPSLSALEKCCKQSIVVREVLHQEASKDKKSTKVSFFTIQ